MDVKRNIHRITPRSLRGDAAIPQETARQLKVISNHVRQGTRLVRTSKPLRGRTAGRGTTILLSGATHQNRLITARLLATELDKPLYKINLGSVLSKRIGETEKNLTEIFDFARASEGILFFDEADALFIKRNAVSAIEQRHSSLAISHFLQSMRKHGGTAILAVEPHAAIDASLLRRMNFVVGFPQVDANPLIPS